MQDALALKRSLRLTKQRRVILEELSKAHTHPTASEIYQLVRKRLPKISLGTVYRNLETLSDYGMIQKLELAGTQRRFDGMRENHYHARCIKCGRVEDVPVPPVPVNEGAVSKLINYEIFSHRLEFLGLCPICKKDKAAAKPSAMRAREKAESAV